MLVEHLGTALAMEEGQAMKNPKQIAPLDGLISVPPNDRINQLC